MSYVLKNNVNDVNLKNVFMDIVWIKNEPSVVEEGHTIDVVEEPAKKEVKAKKAAEKKEVKKRGPKPRPDRIRQSSTIERKYWETDESYNCRIRLMKAIKFIRIAYGQIQEDFYSLLGLSSKFILVDFERSKYSPSEITCKSIIKKILEGDNEIAKELLRYLVLDDNVSDKDREDLLGKLNSYEGTIYSKEYVDKIVGTITKSLNIKKEVEGSKEPVVVAESEEEAIKEPEEYEDDMVEADPTITKFYMSLKYIRHMTGLSGSDLAGKIGITQSYVAYLESGKQKKASRRLYDKFRNFLLTCPQRSVRETLKYIVDNPYVSPEELSKTISGINETYVADYSLEGGYHKDKDNEKLKFMKVIDVCRALHTA